MAEPDKKQLDKIKKQNLWLRDLCSIEHVALGMVKPIDLATCAPEIIVCQSGIEKELFDYWRVVLSSEPQSLSFAGGGRSMACMVRDRVSGGFMGVFALSDLRTTWPAIMQHFGWQSVKDETKVAHQQELILLRRCLPLYEFGQMTGGKLVALMASSRDVIRLLELRYSYQFMYFAIFTLHGKGSQYNRLQQRGIELVSVDEKGRGFYGMELRKKGAERLRSGVTAGKANTHPLPEQIEYWKDRWLKARMASTGAPSLITPDPNRYRLSLQLDAKRARTIPQTEDTTNGIEAEAEA